MLPILPRAALLVGIRENGLSQIGVSRSKSPPCWIPVVARDRNREQDPKLQYLLICKGVPALVQEGRFLRKFCLGALLREG